MPAFSPCATTMGVPPSAFQPPTEAATGAAMELVETGAEMAGRPSVGLTVGEALKRGLGAASGRATMLDTAGAEAVTRG